MAIRRPLCCFSFWTSGVGRVRTCPDESGRVGGRKKGTRSSLAAVPSSTNGRPRSFLFRPQGFVEGRRRCFFFWPNLSSHDPFADQTRYYWVLLVFIGLYWVLLGFDQVSLGFTWFYRVLLGFTGFHWVFLGFVGFLPIFYGFDWVSWGFYQLFMGFTGFYCVLPGFT